MPSWLGGSVVKWVLEWVLGKVLALITAYRQWENDKRVNRDRAAQDMKKAKDLKPDATAKETDEAIDDAFRNL
jgi:t-SNARE complex subunit (syntaxin)